MVWSVQHGMQSIDTEILKKSTFTSEGHIFTSELSGLSLSLLWSVQRASLPPGRNLCEWWVQNLHGHSYVSPEWEPGCFILLWITVTNISSTALLLKLTSIVVAPDFMTSLSNLTLLREGLRPDQSSTNLACWGLRTSRQNLSQSYKFYI